jgi:hypothetical protein
LDDVLMSRWSRWSRWELLLLFVVMDVWLELRGDAWGDEVTEVRDAGGDSLFSGWCCLSPVTVVDPDRESIEVLLHRKRPIKERKESTWRKRTSWWERHRLLIRKIKERTSSVIENTGETEGLAYKLLPSFLSLHSLDSCFLSLYPFPVILFLIGEFLGRNEIERNK